MVDPTIWADEDFGNLSSEAMVMFIGMVSNADDEGRLPGNALYLASTIFPYKGLSIQKATTLRDEVLNKMKSAILFSVDNKEYIQFKNWSSYQSINKPSSSKYPPLPEDYRSPTVALPSNRIEENRKEKKGIESTPAYLSNFPLEDFSDLEATEKQLRLEAETALNWLKSEGETKKDYRAFLRNWFTGKYGKFKKRVENQPNRADNYEIDESGMARLKDITKGFKLKGMN